MRGEHLATFPDGDDPAGAVREKGWPGPSCCVSRSDAAYDGGFDNAAKSSTSNLSCQARCVLFARAAGGLGRFLVRLGNAAYYTMTLVACQALSSGSARDASSHQKAVERFALCLDEPRDAVNFPQLCRRNFGRSRPKLQFGGTSSLQTSLFKQALRYSSCELYSLGGGQGAGFARPLTPSLGRCGGACGPSTPPHL